MKMAYILEKAVEKFLSPQIPQWGPYEEVLDPPFIPQDGNCVLGVGGGLERHDMLYVGEGCNRIFLVKGGKVVWHYDTGAGWELDDIWMLSNGNILFTHMYWAAEISPQKEQKWYLKAPEGTEIHSIQPIGQDRLALLLNAEPAPRLQYYDKKSGELLSDRVLPYWGETGVHPQSRRFRITAEGHVLVCYLTGGRVVEFDSNLREMWSVKVVKPWAAIRLKNGNTLVSDESDDSVKEFTPKGELVWELTQDDLGTYSISGLQSCVRLENGNTILCARGNGGETSQLVEVTAEKEVVWVLRDWMHLGPATSVQILRDGGVPENPGECQR